MLISRVPVVVLTGGPGGGKSTLMRELRAQDPSARRWVLIPESAPLLFQAGLDAREKSFQRAVVRLQMALEEICTKAARPGQVLVCHRGTLDPLAYWLRNSWDEQEFFVHMGMSRAEHCRRYLGVLHLQTAAIGAEDALSPLARYAPAGDACASGGDRPAVRPRVEWASLLCPD